MDRNRNLVEDKVVKAFSRDQLGDNLAALRVVRVDVVSPVSGVTERTYDEQGTDADASDDILVKEEYRESRLGFISTGVWSHCWIERSDYTHTRVESIRRRFVPDADTVVVLVNSGKPGGCNQGGIAAFTRGESADVIAHELGHNLFGLDDEYTEDDRDFKGKAAAPNVSELPEDWDELKWRDLVAAGAPLPTDPHALPHGWNRRTSVGAFEGGGGHFATGIFRPVLECRMNQNHPPWCPVCAREIERVLGEFL
jgi:hypothetical protein